VLPDWLARPILNYAQRKDRNYNISMHVRSNTIWGFLQLYLLTLFRPLRPATLRFKEENERIEAWLFYIRSALAAGNRPLAMEITRCAGIIKGYGDTYNRGLADYDLIVEKAIKPALAGEITQEAAAEAVKRARLAVMGDPDGEQPGSRNFEYIPLVTAD
jgi:indolepyruvate ferredoxin oxidoreductase beta subunit